jgi:NDP-sugar pyrophosphorylase family protein
MKAFVMAAGAGTRLRPLTFAIPKPMVPVVNKPVLEHTIENLKSHGIHNVALNLHHYPAMIRDYFGNGSGMGMSIRYSYERKLLGTAGGVKNMEKFFDTTFIVMSGDGLTDIDITKAVRFHKEKRSIATMVLKAIDARFEYGVTIIDDDCRIKKFVEKPSWSDVFANTVNTGIYIFEPEILKFIPAKKYFDFGYELWPLLLEHKKRIFGYVTQDYWTDVGNLTEYKKGVRDTLDGRCKVKIPGEQVKSGIWIGRGSEISKSAKLNAPCVIGCNCNIGKGAVVDSYTAIGNDAVVGAGAKIKNSILWDGVKVAANVKLDSCIIGYNARVSEDISVFEGTVLNVEK